MRNRSLNYLFDFNLTIKKLSCIFIAVILILFCVVQNGYSDTKLQETKRKINNLKILEKKEMNKLNKNQMKL